MPRHLLLALGDVHWCVVESHELLLVLRTLWIMWLLGQPVVIATFVIGTLSIIVLVSYHDVMLELI